MMVQTSSVPIRPFFNNLRKTSTYFQKHRARFVSGNIFDIRCNDYSVIEITGTSRTYKVRYVVVCDVKEPCCRKTVPTNGE